MSQDTIPESFQQRIQKAKEQQLEELDLSSYWDAGKEQIQELTRIPDEVFELTHLKKLSLSNNKIQEIPSQISRLTNLESLDLIGNKEFTDIPEELRGFLRSVLLKLTWEVHTPIPEWFSQVKQLGLHLIESRASARIESRETIPDTIVNLENLFWLRISIKFSEDWLSWLKTLNELELYLSYNQLTTLPESITKLSNLTTLGLRTNRLTNLPESLGNLSNLTRLDLRNNRLTNLPESLGNLSNLTRLYLSYNQLTTLPESITKLSNLTELDLGNTKLTTLPESITKLSNLTGLNLSFNQLNTLPESITKLSNLTRLDLSNNPLETPPLEVAQKGIESIREYFRQLQEEGTDYIYEAKLLIVGEAGAGKTTLAKKIDSPNYQLDFNEKSTEGIDITKWSFLFLDEEQKEHKFKVNIWDFGGQEIYHTTHQFFLTKRSLYALVADTRKEDTDFYYWLNVVELLSNNSPCIIVKNEKGDRYIDIDENSLRGRFENLKESLATNLQDNRGLNDILDSIKYHIAKLPHVGSALPKTWKRVRETLEQDPRNYISLEEYLQICQDNGFTQLKDKLQLSGYLHDLGVCLHFQDSPLLRNTVILKPEWGTDAVYKVLDDKQVINNLGEFTTKDLDKIWSDEQYLFKQAELLELMMRFKLCYQIPGTQDTYIAPQLLTNTKPDYDWDKTDNLILRYTYEFMPKGIITQFIVVMHQYIYQQQYVWRSGVVLDKDNTLAEIIEYYDKREITIRIVGKLKRDLMTQITYELDKINNSYNRLKYQKLIPCNCETCKNNQKPYTYQFNELVEKRLANNKLTIECGNPPFHEVQILSLIDNAIDIQQLISQAQKDSHRNINFQGDTKQLILQIFGDFMQENKNINQNRSINISDNAQVTASGAGAFSQGDNHGTIANKINQHDSQQSKDSKVIKILGALAAVATIIALFFNGIFNTEVRQWFDNLFDKNVPSKTEPGGK